VDRAPRRARRARVARRRHRRVVGDLGDGAEVGRCSRAEPGRPLARGAALLAHARDRPRPRARARRAHELRRRAGLRALPCRSSVALYARSRSRTRFGLRTPATTIDALRIEAGRRAWGPSCRRTRRRGKRDWGTR
jgi:hypothetical protein